MGGDNRQLAHYDGSAWKKIATGTTLSIQDIFGAKNPQTGAWEVLAVAGDQLHSLAREVLRVEGLTATAIPDRPFDRPVNTVCSCRENGTAWLGRGCTRRRVSPIPCGRADCST